MKLINETLNKLKLIIVLIIIALELCLFSIVISSYKFFYTNTLDLTKNYTINKTIDATRTLNDLLRITLYRYLCDLKLIGKHMSFLSSEENDSKYIRTSSNYYKNIILNEDKKIVYATMEELKKISILNKFYNNETHKYDYLSYYNREYIESGQQAQIINYLKNKNIHPELNMIAYYKLNGDSNVDLLDENKKRAAKYIISIFKSILIRRFITRGVNHEFMNYFIFIDDEMYIYPPEAFNNTYIFYISNLYRFNCGYHMALQTFPKCVYEYMNNRENNFTSDRPGYFRPSIFESKLYFNHISVNYCINIPFIKNFDLFNLTYNPFLCQETNFTKFFYNDLFEEKDSFEFIFFFINDNYESDIVPIYNDKKERYELIKTVFNDEKFKKFQILENSDYNAYSLFHFLYIDIFKDRNIYKYLKCSIDDILKEYEEIKNKILYQLTILNKNKTNSKSGGSGSGISFGIDTDYKVIDIEKTNCRSSIYSNSMKCIKDTFLLIIYPLYGNFSLINENFLEDQRYPIDLPLFYCLSIISNNNKYMKWKIKNIIMIKIFKIFLFYIIITISIMLIYMIFIQIFHESKYNLINQIIDVLQNGQFFEIKDKNEITQKKELFLLEPNNKDMAEVKELFDKIVKTMILKFDFDEKNISFMNINNNTKKKKKNKNKKNEKNESNENTKNSNLEYFNDYMDLIKKLINPEIKIMCLFIIAYGHFKKDYFKLAENEFKNIIIEINNYENKITDKNEDTDAKLKDSISRCSKISYLNEYSLTNEMNETTLPIIKIKLLKQKILYLYALCIYKQEKYKNNSTQNNDNKKNNKETKKKRYEEAIKYLTECKNISSLLGTDTIREIFSLIMISKCYIELKNYKESMVNMHEASLLYSDLQKSFKDKNFFDARVMLFAENFIFQNIMLCAAQITYNFNKIPQSCWILMKIIETSPFIFNNIHNQACFILNNCLKQMESNITIAPRQLDKYRKNINKIYARINIRMLNKEKIVNKEILLTTNNNTTTNITSNPSVNNSQVNIFSIPDNRGSNLKRLTNKKDLYTNKFNNASLNSGNPLSRNRYKNITLCISEKILMNINGEELKDVLLKFFQKCFSNSTDEDKFGFIQFSYNGKKTISIKSEPIDYFLQKLESNKGAFQLNENYNKTTNEIQFMEFSNLFFSIIKSHKQQNIEDKNDHIIIIFINTEDIRFNGKKECVDTINELNSNNYTLIIFTYDVNISKEKIESIHSFLCGLNDGHFFQIKNYQQIKQVLMNFSIKESQEKLVNYDYEITDYML